MVQKSYHEPEGLLLVTSTYTEQKSYQKVHRLKIAHVRSVHGIGLKNIFELLLTLEIFSKVFQVWKCSIDVLADVLLVNTICIFTSLFDLLLVDPLPYCTLIQDMVGYKSPS